jgi:hypothetical protein
MLLERSPTPEPPGRGGMPAPGLVHETLMSPGPQPPVAGWVSGSLPD